MSSEGKGYEHRMRTETQESRWFQKKEFTPWWQQNKGSRKMREVEHQGKKEWWKVKRTSDANRLENETGSIKDTEWWRANEKKAPGKRCGKRWDNKISATLSQKTWLKPKDQRKKEPDVQEAPEAERLMNSTEEFTQIKQENTCTLVGKNKQIQKDT